MLVLRKKRSGMKHKGTLVVCGTWSWEQIRCSSSCGRKKWWRWANPITWHEEVDGWSRTWGRALAMAAGGDVEARAMGGQVAGVRHATAMEACDDLDACVGKKKRIWKGRRKKKRLMDGSHMWSLCYPKPNTEHRWFHPLQPNNKHDHVSSLKIEAGPLYPTMSFNQTHRRNWPVGNQKNNTRSSRCIRRVASRHVGARPAIVLQGCISCLARRKIH